jgi:hypothetical protein
VGNRRKRLRLRYIAVWRTAERRSEGTSIRKKRGPQGAETVEGGTVEAPACCIGSNRAAQERGIHSLIAAGVATVWAALCAINAGTPIDRRVRIRVVAGPVANLMASRAGQRKLLLLAGRIQVVDSSLAGH